MGLLIFLQVIFDLAFIATATLLLIERSKSRTMEDPRLSRGLQLLSSKIAILQDLMDRSEVMSKQLSQLMDGKQQDIQERLEEAEVHLHRIKKATEKSQEVAKIFQEQIPHQEIMERQTTAKYLFAAKLSNQGLSFEEISKQVDIPRGELDLIVKVNRDRLLVEDEPSWAKQPTQSVQAPQPLTQQINAMKAEINPIVIQETEFVGFSAKIANAGNKEATVRPVIFKKISSVDELDLKT
jgi:hypothetical protein